MNLRYLILVIPPVVFGLGAPAFSQAPPAGNTVVQALAAKTAAIHDYHYRAEWTMLAGVRPYTLEYWYAGPDQVRTSVHWPGTDRPTRHTLIKGVEAYTISAYQYEVTKLPDSGGRERVFSSLLGEVIGPVYLTAGDLALWSEVEIKGTEPVGGVPCHVVDLPTGGSALSGSLREDGDEFVAFIPRTGGSRAFRVWFDAETGMARRWGRVSSGRVGSPSEVIETRQVNGFAFPALIKMSEGGIEGTARITEAEVNQGVSEALAEFRPPPNWLVRDRTLTLNQVRERLEAEPDDANLHYTLGRLYQRTRPDDAAEAFRRAAELAPESPTPLLALGEVLQGRREVDREAAFDALRQAVALAGEDPWFARMQLAQALRRADNTDEAIREYRELAAAGPPLSYWLVGQLAQALAGKGDFEGAYRAAADVPVPALGILGSELGSIVEWATKSDHLDDLRAKAEQAVAAAPESGAARLLLAKVLHAQGRNAEAAEALKAIPLTLESALWRTMPEVVSLARDLGEEEFAAQVRRAAVRQALKSGRAWGMSDLFQGEELTEGVVSEVIGEGAAVWAEAADAQSRAAILDIVSDVAESIYWRDRRDQAALVRDPDEMTPAESAVVGALAAALTDYAGGPEGVQEARRRAAAYFERALTAWPDDAPLWARVGQMCWRAKDWEGAAEAYGKAAAADPDQIEYPARVAFATTRLGEHDHGARGDEPCRQALDIGRKAIEPWPDEWAAKAFFASLQMCCEQLEPARDTLVALYASPEVQESYQGASLGRLLARCHERLGELDQAEAVLKRAVAESQDYRRTDSYRRLIRFYARHDRRADTYAAAKAFYIEAGDGRWRQPQEAVRMVQAAFEDDAEALAAAVAADLAAHPGDADTIRFAAAVYERTGQLEKVLPLLAEAAVKADDAGVWIQLAEVAERTGDDALAAKALRRAVELRPDDEDLRMRLAHAAAAQGDTKAAKALADQLRGDAGDSPDAWREVAELYLIAQSWDDAFAAAERVLALTPETDEAAQMRAEVLVARAYAGKRDDHEARRRLIRVLGRAKDSTVLREAADALVDLYLLREERRQAIATLEDLRLRTQDRSLLDWIDARLKEIAGD